MVYEVIKMNENILNKLSNTHFYKKKHFISVSNLNLFFLCQAKKKKVIPIIAFTFVTRNKICATSQTFILIDLTHSVMSSIDINILSLQFTFLLPL